jgi:hypothetical protein
VAKPPPNREAIKKKVEVIAADDEGGDELETLFDAVAAGGFGKDVDEVLSEVAARSTKGKGKPSRKEKQGQRGPKKTQDSKES